VITKKYHLTAILKLVSTSLVFLFRFVSKIEGNAVEEGEKVFFEGIVDAQPQPSKIIKTI
jgi:hypothetical protein